MTVKVEIEQKFYFNATVLTVTNKPSSSAFKDTDELTLVDPHWTGFQFSINITNSSKPVCKAGGYTAKNNDLFTLLPPKWVNDIIIDSFWLKCGYSECLRSNYAYALSYSIHFVE